MTVPAVMGDEAIWALPCLPLAGPGMGAYLIPEVGAGVWVEFEAGDPSYPVWSGCYWGDGQTPTDNEGTDASPTLKVIRSKEGLMVTLNDEDQVITVSDKDGKNVVTIEVMAGTDHGQRSHEGDRRSAADRTRGKRHPSCGVR